MNELEATEAKLKCLKMVEGTGLKWWDVVKVLNRVQFIAPDFSSDEKYYEFALGVVEGKPVWKGDTLWHKHYGQVLVGVGEGVLLGKDNAHCFSWNPPVPKTIMVELTTDDVKFFSTLSTLGIHYPDGRLVASCKKALEYSKCK